MQIVPLLKILTTSRSQIGIFVRILNIVRIMGVLMPIMANLRQYNLAVGALSTVLFVVKVRYQIVHGDLELFLELLKNLRCSAVRGIQIFTG
jgi:hypothetical protein